MDQKKIRTLGIDTRMLHHTGIGTYLRGVLPSILKSDLMQDAKVTLFGKPLDGFPSRGQIDCKAFRSNIYSVWEQWEYWWHLRNCDLWHAPHYNVPLLKPRKTRLVVTIHDLIHWIFRNEYFSRAQGIYAATMLKRAVELSDHVITVSEHTKNDLIQYFHANPEKVSVIYEGISQHYRRLDNQLVAQNKVQTLGIKNRYLLYVGLLKPHKQVHWLIRNFKELRRKGLIQSDLVIVGKKDKKYPPECESLSHIESGEGMHYFNFVEDEELVALYNRALALVHPSHYEGFGLTLLEAMACETPVIACKVASIPEVGGDAVYYVTPGQDGELGMAIRDIESKQELRDHLVSRGNEQVRKFSWQKAAEQTIDVYDKVLS